jgi:hypothetical protein
MWWENTWKSPLYWRKAVRTQAEEVMFNKSDGVPWRYPCHERWQRFNDYTKSTLILNKIWQDSTSWIKGQGEELLGVGDIGCKIKYWLQKGWWVRDREGFCALESDYLDGGRDSSKRKCPASFGVAFIYNIYWRGAKQKNKCTKSWDDSEIWT